MKHIAYISGQLPVRSETFVYREIFALRELGVSIQTVSVHAPATGLGAQVLNDLAETTIALYPPGKIALCMDALKQMLEQPVHTLGTLGMILHDVIAPSDVGLAYRPKLLYQGIAGLAMAQRLQGKNIGHIHAHMAHVPTTIAMYAARQMGISFSFTGHANDLFPNRTLLKEKLARAAFVHCISRWHQELYQSICPKDPAALPVIRCGVDTRAIQAVPHAARTQTAILGIGRLVPKKGFDILIEAARILADRGLDFSVTIAGTGPEEDRLNSLISSLSLSGRARLAGEVSNEQVFTLLADHDILVMPCRVSGSSDRDGIPVVLMEAMTVGRCVIAGDLPAIRELISDGETGCLIPPDKPILLADLLERLAGDRARQNRMEQAARKKIEAEFDINENARKIMDNLRVHGIL